MKRIEIASVAYYACVPCGNRMLIQPSRKNRSRGRKSDSASRGPKSVVGGGDCGMLVMRHGRKERKNESGDSASHTDAFTEKIDLG